jgi:hypothetical protein
VTADQPPGQGDLNRPWQNFPHGRLQQLNLDDVEIGSGLVLQGGMIPAQPGHPAYATLVFKFADGRGGWHPDRYLIMSPSDMAGLEPLLISAIRAAVTACEQQKRAN